MSRSSPTGSTPALAGARVTVMGIGRFGGGVGVIRHLLARGARVTATDVLDATALADSLAMLERLDGRDRLELRLGGHSRGEFVESDLVVANPAVRAPWSNEWLAAARTAGVPITTEIRLAIDALPGRRFIGVTGTVGKSSTASMIHHALGRLGVETALGGNIGGSLLDEVDAIPARSWVVLELSSFMLHWLGEDARPWSPEIAVLTNLRPNHLDWHGDFGHYAASKGRIVAHQATPRLVTAFALEDPAGARTAALAGGDWWTAPSTEGEQILRSIDLESIELLVPGLHQRRNARLALATAALACRLHGMRVEPARLHAALADFRGLPHRLEALPSRRGFLFVNDSKSTTPESTLLAIESLGDPSRVHLIAGGADKGIDLAPIRDRAGSLAGLYAIGVTAPQLVASPHARLSGTLRQAVADASGRMRSGDILLLSPGCASWDQFTDYRARGEAFAAAVVEVFGDERSERAPTTSDRTSTATSR